MFQGVARCAALCSLLKYLAVFHVMVMSILNLLLRRAPTEIQSLLRSIVLTLVLQVQKYAAVPVFEHISFRNNICALSKSSILF